MSRAGAGVGVLTNFVPDMKYNVDVPTDNRQKEIAKATLFVSVSSVYLSLQVASVVEPDLHPWATLAGGVAALITVMDVFFQSGEGLREATAGFKRMVLKDEEREEFVEASGLMLGYLMGLPCFAFQPDVNEAIKTLCSKTSCMNSYMMQRGEGNAINEIDDTAAFDNMSRMLVWMMAPIAAEIMKYGETVISDPRFPPPVTHYDITCHREKTVDPVKYRFYIDFEHA